MADTKLYAKLAEVVAEVLSVERDGTNTFHKYKYTSAEAMLRALRGPLAARSIALLPSVTDIAEREITTGKGNASTVTTVRLSFTFVDGETGETHVCEWAGQGDDPADKGLGKAYTNAVKTFLREAFLIPQGDDPEADTKTDERARDRVSAASQPARREPARANVVPNVPDPNPVLVAAARGLKVAEIKTAFAMARVEWPTEVFAIEEVFVGLTDAQAAKLEAALLNQRTDLPVDLADYEPPDDPPLEDEFERALKETFGATEVEYGAEP